MSSEESDPATEEDVAAAREEVIAVLADTAEAYGGKRSYGRLFGICYFAEGSLSLDELVGESGYAKSTVSTAMRTLERYNLVRRQSKDGAGKRVYFEAETDFWEIFQAYLDEQVRAQIDDTGRTLQVAEMVLEESPELEAERDREKIASLRETFTRFAVVLDLLTETPPDDVLELAEELPAGED